MEKLKEKLREYIDLYGLSDERTIEISQELDELIVQKMKEHEDK
ncbi:aspartyl-phosphate phosphatase Spo0E family protein [Clostridium sp. WLY-B-L2]|uniref:Aspartyl-phosphate phosphatase Spo0E family protein n=1 Tax=Clostridium aromativorans TaxID=2836848 RepID=A0ABS8N9P4_9CLOT|nr:aspartyl-phosphate phosphatase Spo0E family protein [Clostridium aromativorans]MCC9296529.1 aspartyl-phosphate phosphatase Spo0E family protein [Clostridium aromativorans]